MKLETPKCCVNPNFPLQGRGKKEYPTTKDVPPYFKSHPRKDMKDVNPNHINSKEAWRGLPTEEDIAERVVNKMDVILKLLGKKLGVN
jgi:hypothetical protein